MNQTKNTSYEAAEKWVAGFAEHWSSPEPDRLRELMHPDTRNRIPPMKEPADREGVVAHFKDVLRQLPTLRLEVERWAVAGDAVFVEWTARARVGTRELSWRGIDRVRLRDGRTYEGEAFWDTRALAELVADAIGGGAR
jgi:ketosteroid isomerase-like protein